MVALALPKLQLHNLFKKKFECYDPSLLAFQSLNVKMNALETRHFG